MAHSAKQIQTEIHADDNIACELGNNRKSINTQSAIYPKRDKSPFEHKNSKWELIMERYLSESSGS